MSRASRIHCILRISMLAVVLGLIGQPSTAEAKRKSRASKKQREKEAKAPTPDGEEAESAAQTSARELANASEDIEVDRVLAHAAKLSVDIGPRPANSSAAGLAAQYVADELALLGLDVERQEVGTQVMPAIDLGVLYRSPERSFTTLDPNLIVRLVPEGKAKDKPILFMAHYDSVPGSPGVVDNAIAVGLLLEFARVLLRTPPQRPIILAFPAAEENGLMGARALAEKFSGEIGLAVSLDLVGSRGDLTLNGLSELMHQRWLLWLAEVGKKAQVDVRAPWTHRVISRLFPEIERSDHGPFTQRGIPAFHLYHRSDEAIFLAYHTPHDTMSGADRASIEDAAKFISMMSHIKFAIPKVGEKPGVWLPFPGGARVVSSMAVQVLWVTCLLIAILSMVNLRRATRDKPEPNVEGRKLSLGSAILLYVLTWLITGLVMKMLVGGSGHALPWAHAPGRVILAGILMAASIGWLLTIQTARFGTWVGEARYLYPAVGFTSFVGFFMLAFGLFELAWIMLVPSAALGAVGGSKKLMGASMALVLAALPLLGPLSPSFLREAIFHRFWMTGLPLFAYVGLLLLPYGLAIGFLTRRYSISALRARTGLIACAVLFLVAAIIAGTTEVPCTAEEYRLEGLTCEIAK